MYDDHYSMEGLDGEVVTTVYYYYYCIGGIGGPGFDYENAPTEYTISGTGSVQAPVVIIDDMDPEGMEMFSGDLEAGDGGSRGGSDFNNIMFAPNMATATISDNDGNEKVWVEEWEEGE
jgi:hypothetical protein